ncbi:glycoside hydrolase [Streptomyces eurocidicus]|uniref:Cell wall-associated NlpC family hydrolase n=1 Tax=Streptomyces eurocidicus TaxID=66423 RepID=A0A2N8NQ27_STREU|nr:C40 family peptidase [Streptomyces eurocidicus]MBB5122363.1 cell wall-associated NlpC family hydrolase [Streptomyces eurocidicus]MBF6051647.1 NlpC/P60 family protein [Streptomyces eurocidicus]PNE30864.1 glycoside hydrolase [Streptomyces eurocidicus]
MSAIPGIPALKSRAVAASVLTAATVTASMLLPGMGSEAQAATPGQTAVKVAASKKGSPYQYGAVGPNRFDCSGLTLYSFKKAGKTLPRTAAQQYNKTRHLSAGSRQVGDLVFFHSGSNVYHVGIYAGDNKIWHSPKPGASVRMEKIWSSSVWYGRVN